MIAWTCRRTCRSACHHTGSQARRSYLQSAKIMVFAKFRDGRKVEWVAERVGHHNCLGLALSIGFLKLLHAGIKRARIIVDEHRHKTVLHDGSDRRRKTRRLSLIHISEPT